MITKLGYAQQLISILYPTTTDDRKLREQEAALAISQARDILLKREILQNKRETNAIYGNWLSTFFDNKAYFDKNLNKYVIKLPARPISLIGDMGVYHVFPKGSEENMFVPVTSGFSAMHLKSLSSMLGGNMAYYLDGNKIVFLNELSKDQPITIRMVAMGEDIPLDDYFPVDGSIESEMLQLAVNLYSTQKQINEDIISDSISQ
tara:strand:- start:398 stop:1012 length:615 start_codon:yes stop_codon:yes gene_type:complete